MTDRLKRTTRHLTATGVLAGVLGLALFAYTLHSTGIDKVWGGITALGVAGFAAVVALSGLRLLVRAAAWTRCVDSPERLPLRDAFGAMLMGEAIGNLTPFALVVSEPAKAAFVRHRVPLSAAFSAIVVENLVYSTSVAVVITIGAIGFLLSFHVSDALRAVSLATVAGMGLVALGTYSILGRGAKPVTQTLMWLARVGLGRRLLGRQAPRVWRFESRLNEFFSQNRARLLPLLALEATYHVAGVLEVYVTLLLVAGMGTPTLLTALILESTGRVINIVFRYVPMRLGVDEVGSGFMTATLGLGQAAGVTLGLVRKARILTWSAAGVVLLLHRGLTPGRALAQAEAVTADKRFLSK